MRPAIPPPKNDRLRANNQIRARSVRLIDAEGKQVGIVPLEEALRQARLAELDLVEVSPGTVPPVCKILDYGKYQYEQAKREKESRKHQKKVDVKGVRLRFLTDDHDRLLKQKRVEEFLTDGDKVRIEIVLRGRERAHRGLARGLLENFFRTIAVPYTVEEPIAQSPRGFAATIAPQRRNQ